MSPVYAGMSCQVHDHGETKGAHGAEVEERGVDDEVRHALVQLVPLQQPHASRQRMLRLA